MAMPGFTDAARWVAAGTTAAVLLASAAAAQEPTPTTACGTVVRRGFAPSAAGDSTTGARALIELRRVTETQRAAVASAMAGGGAAGGGANGGGRVRLLGTRGWLGVQASELSEMRLTGEGRVVRYCDYPVVVTVEPGSPASRAGLEAGDTIVAYNGSDLRAAGEIALDRLLVPDDTLRIGLRRSGRPLTLPVVIGRAPAAGSLQALSTNGPGFTYVVINNGVPETMTAPVAPTMAGATPAAAPRVGRLRVATRPPDAPMTPGAPSAAFVPAPSTLFSFGFGGAGAMAGAQVVAMDDDLAAVVGVRSGVLVVKVIDGTPAGSAGLRSGDVVVTADGVAVTSPAMLQRALLRAGDERAVRLRVSRRGKARDVSLRW